MWKIDSKDVSESNVFREKLFLCTYLYEKFICVELSLPDGIARNELLQLSRSQYLTRWSVPPVNKNGERSIVDANIPHTLCWFVWNKPTNYYCFYWNKSFCWFQECLLAESYDIKLCWRLTTYRYNTVCHVYNWLYSELIKKTSSELKKFLT